MGALYSKTRWIVGMAADNDRARIVAFPPAGGSAASFHQWRTLLPDSVSLLAVQPTARGSRLNEPGIESIDEYVRGVGPALTQYLDRPLVIVGQSYGALVALEAVHHLSRTTPQCEIALLVLLAAPSLADYATTHDRLPELSDESLMIIIADINPSLSAAMTDDMVRGLVLPAWRADTTAAHTWGPSPRPPILCPILLIQGSRDWLHGDKPELVGSWQDQTSAEMTVEVLEGDHGFAQSNPAATVELILRHVLEL